MSDDLINRLRLTSLLDPILFGEAADRIEELEARNQELTLQLLAAHGQAADALDKLAKAVEALRDVDNEYTDIQWGPELQSIKQVRTVLAELEGK